MRWLLDRLFEMAYDRKDAIRNIQGIAVPVLNHLIKILKWKHDDSYYKHITDINNWLYQVQDSEWGGRGKESKKFTKDVYYRLLFDEPMGINGINILKSKIRRTLKDYANNTVTRTDEQVIEKLDAIYLKVSNDISRDKFEDIRDYL
jgi:hypothetical protein